MFSCLGFRLCADIVIFRIALLSLVVLSELRGNGVTEEESKLSRVCGRLSPQAKSRAWPRESVEPRHFFVRQAASGNSLQRSVLDLRSSAKICNQQITLIPGPCYLCCSVVRFAFPIMRPRSSFLSSLYRTCHPERTPRERSDRGGVEGSRHFFVRPSCIREFFPKIRT